MEKTDRQIYEEFVTQLSEWGNSGKKPLAANQDICYGLMLQRKRMDKYHVKMEYKMGQWKERQGNMATTAAFSDVRYTNKVACKSYRKEVAYYRQGKKSLVTKDNELLYMIITWLNNETVQDTYCCPNCGAISDINVLLEGCPYCHTKFLMSDLFPKVTNFYFLRDYSLSEEDANGRIRRWMAGGAAIGFIIRAPGLITDIIHGGNLFFLLLAAAFTMGIAAVFGYFALSLSLFFKVLKDCFKQAPRAVGQLNAKKKLTDIMKQYDPGFTYEYFIGKVQGLLKILIFADDRNDLAVFEGDASDCSCLDEIIDAQFDGAISLNRIRVEGNYCYLDLNVYMTDVYCRKNSLQQKSDLFLVGLCRNISHPEDYGFSINKVCCKSCGASYDATRERLCPYCKTRYDLKEDDWVITYIRKK